MTPPPPSAAESEAGDTRSADRALAAGRIAPLAELLSSARAATTATTLAVVLSTGFLLARLAPNVAAKPVYEDEALAGLTSVLPLGQLLDVVLFDRGGAPLHFVLAHVALSLDPSVEALRWLSVVFAVGAVLLCYDIGRRLGGRAAGVTAAIVAATSAMLAVYGTFGRMYALFAFVSALAIDLFVRALDLRTGRAAFVAGLGALLLPAAHPYGIVVVALEAAVALALWRGRPLRPALPVLALGLGLVPFVVADLRLSERFGVSVFEDESIAPPGFAAEQLGEALTAFAGGTGGLALLFFALALAGLFAAAGRRPAFAAFALAALAAVPILMAVGRAEEELVTRLSPRHLMFALPIWAGLVGLGVARVLRDLPRGATPLVVGAVALAALLAPSGVAEPDVNRGASRAALAEPADWVRAELEPGGVLLFDSPVYLAALPETLEARTVPRSGRPLRMIERAAYPVPSAVLSLRSGGTRFRLEELHGRLRPGSAVGVFPDWLVVRIEGPFRDEHAILRAAMSGLVASLRTAHRPPLSFRREIRAGLITVCGALAELGDPCPRYVLPPKRDV